MRDILAVRDAFADYPHVDTDELFAGAGAATEPFLTIAIPTHRRPGLLAEAVRSALAQDFDRPFEVVVVDDDATSTGHERLLRDVPEIAGANFRYMRNRENLRDFGNHNRCIEVARGQWCTIHHDDDLIDPNFASSMFAQLDADSSIDGLVCQKRMLDCREVKYVERRRRKVLRKIVEFGTFGFRRVRTIRARQLFWSCVVGNTVGFIFRKQDALSLGGFYTEDYPSADYYFYARFANRFRLCEHRGIFASIRIEVNVSRNLAVKLGAAERALGLQRAYAGIAVPHYWRRLTPLILARQVTLQERIWRAGLTRQAASAHLGVNIPKDRPTLLYLLRGLMRGF
jgi:glycosyltransferase involved in cell wall biosynthesis